MDEIEAAGSWRLLDLLFDDDAAGRCLVGPDGAVVRANAAWLRAMGLTREEALGAAIIDLLPEQRAIAPALHARARAGHHVDVPRHARSVQGRASWWEGSVDPVPMAGGVGLLITSREVRPASAGPPVSIGHGTVGSAGIRGEVTARSEAEVSLRESEERFRVLTDALPQIVCVLAPDGTPEYVNRTWIAFSGLDLQGTRAGWDRLLHPDDVEAARDCVRRALRSLGAQEVELRYRAADGTYRWFLSRLAPLIERGRVIRFVGAAMDIEDRKRAQQALQTTAEDTRVRARELQAVLDAVPAAVFITRDRDARTMEANRFCTEALRMPAGTNVSMSAPSGAQVPFTVMRDGVALPPEELPVQIAARTGREVRDCEFDLVFEDGSRRHMVGNATPLLDPDGAPAGAVGAFLDITDRQRAETALRAEERKYRSLFESSVDAVYLTQADGTILDANGAACRLHQMTVDEIRAAGRAGLVVSDARHVAALAERAATGQTRAELVYVRKDGSTFPTETESVLIDRSAANPSAFVTARDITERKRAEELLRESAERLREADRRKDEFLGMLSHELRNPLAPIRNALFILDHATSGDQARRARAIANRQVAHLSRLVDDLLDVTRIARGKVELRREELDLARLAQRTAEDYRALLQDRDLDLTVDLPDAPVIVNGDPARLTQVLGNLLSNAAKFTPAGGRIGLSLRTAGGDAVLHVVDTGPGIAPEMLATIFDPFTQAKQTLARSEGGLGLGLSLVKGLVSLHGGTVAVSSRPGQGADFAVTLSLARPAGAGLGAAPAAAPPPSAPRHHVLVVDDNRDAAESLAELVRLLGHEVEVAYDGPSALAVAGEEQPDVVLCDIGLPGMDGYAVARALRLARGAGLRVVALSGYAQPEDVARAMESGFDRHVAKPPDPAKIAELLT